MTLTDLVLCTSLFIPRYDPPTGLDLVPDDDFNITFERPSRIGFPVIDDYYAGDPKVELKYHKLLWAADDFLSFWKYAMIWDKVGKLPYDNLHCQQKRNHYLNGGGDIYTTNMGSGSWEEGFDSGTWMGSQNSGQFKTNWEAGNLKVGWNLSLYGPPCTGQYDWLPHTSVIDRDTITFWDNGFREMLESLKHLNSLSTYDPRTDLVVIEHIFYPRFGFDIFPGVVGSDQDSSQRPTQIPPFVWELYRKELKGVYGLKDDILGNVLAYGPIFIPPFGFIGQWMTMIKMWSMVLNLGHFSIGKTMINIIETTRQMVYNLDEAIQAREGGTIEKATDRLFYGIHNLICQTFDRFAKFFLKWNDKVEEIFPLVYDDNGEPKGIDLAHIATMGIPWILKYLPGKYSPWSRIDLEDMSIRADEYFETIQWNLWVRKPPFWDWKPDMHHFKEWKTEDGEPVAPVRLMSEFAVIAGVVLVSIFAARGPLKWILSMFIRPLIRVFASHELGTGDAEIEGFSEMEALLRDIDEKVTSLMAGEHLGSMESVLSESVGFDSRLLNFILNKHSRDNVTISSFLEDLQKWLNKVK
jgi:hypothetical protein